MYASASFSDMPLKNIVTQYIIERGLLGSCLTVLLLQQSYKHGADVTRHTFCVTTNVNTTDVTIRQYRQHLSHDVTIQATMLTTYRRHHDVILEAYLFCVGAKQVLDVARRWRCRIGVG